MTRQPWFGPKRLGFGIGPRSWQGWCLIAVFAVASLVARQFIRMPGYPVLVGVAATVLVAAILWQFRPRDP
jgi:hypothetical protein